MPQVEPPKPRLRVRFDNVVALRHLSLHTSRQYWHHFARFVQYHRLKSEAELRDGAEAKIAAWLTAEARRGVSVSTQHQALNALVFVFRDVLNLELGQFPAFARATRPERLPDVPASHEDAMKIVGAVPGDAGLALRLIYGSALRLHDCLRLRLKDLDFANGEIYVRGSKGDKDRVVPLPSKLARELRDLVARREVEHAAEKRDGRGWVFLPGLLGRKNPKLHFETGWQYVFAQAQDSRDPSSGKRGRHHTLPDTLQRALRSARTQLRIKKRITPHSLRHASAREMERRGTPIAEIQKALGHRNVETTMRYLGSKDTRKPRVKGPLD